MIDKAELLIKTAIVIKLTDDEIIFKAFMLDYFYHQPSSTPPSRIDLIYDERDLRISISKERLQLERSICRSEIPKTVAYMPVIELIIDDLIGKIK